MEVADGWAVGRRYFSRESMDKLLRPEPALVAEPEPLRLAPVR